MRDMRSVWRVCMATALALAASGCGASLPKMSGDFADVTREMESVAVMPAHFSLGQVGAFSAQELSELNHDIEIEVGGAFQELVGESRYRLAPLDVSDAALESDPELRAALFEQNQAMAQVFEQLAKSRSKTIDIPYTASLDLLADRSGADQLLFVSGSGFFKTTGRHVKDVGVAVVAAAFGFVSSSGPSSGTHLEAILVDANRGKVLWYNAASDQKDPRKPSEILQVAQKVSRPLLGVSTLPRDRSRDQELIDKYKALGKTSEPDSTE